MPDMSRTLSPQQIWAVIAFLESQSGTVDVGASDIPAGNQGGLTPGASPGNSGAPRLANGNTDPMTLFHAAGCVGCHKIGAEGGNVGPDLSHVGARRSAESIRTKILDPASSTARGYERFAGIMPKTFGTTLTAAQFEALVRFLAAHK